MRRRRFLAAIAGAAALRPAWLHAQQPGHVYRIGVLTGLPPAAPNYVALWENLGRLGFAEGTNLEVDRGGYALKPDELAGHADALAKQRVDLIQCSGAAAFRAAQQATATIPIMGGTDDIVGEGLVPSLAHPGGNTTGVTILAFELDGKRLQILLELLPQARRIGVLAGGDSVTPARLEALKTQASGKGVELIVRVAQQADEIAPSLDALAAAGAAGVNVLASASLFFSYPAILERTRALRLPAIYQWPGACERGGLIGYGPDLVRIYGDQLSRIAAEILRGTRPADIPVERPTNFYLKINQKTAAALGVTVPPLLLAQADEVVE